MYSHPNPRQHHILKPLLAWPGLAPVADTVKMNSHRSPARALSKPVRRFHAAITLAAAGSSLQCVGLR